MTRRLLLLLSLAACGSTGGHLVTFDVAAAGAPGAGVQDTALGWHVALDKLTVHVGAVYLNLAVANSGSLTSTACILPGIYTGEELGGLDVDVLSTTPQPFPLYGHGTDDDARTGEVWLTGGDVNAIADTTVIAAICGTATNATTSIPFFTSITIGATNRGIPATNPATPSQHPICKQRIVTPITIDFRPHAGGTLLVTIDPSSWFATTDFTTLPIAAAAPFDCPNEAAAAQVFQFPDDNSIPASQNLFTALRSANGTFSLSFH